MNLDFELLVGIVDDNAIMREVTRAFLGKTPVSVVFEAENGQQCIDKIKSLQQIPDVIILDLEMPVMNGFQTSVIVKELWPTILIIIFSGTEDESKIQTILQSGAEYFLPKYSDPLALATLIRSIHLKLSAQMSH
ncbi:MAG: response regulator transcription factor [Dyadobacter sp.]